MKLLIQDEFLAICSEILSRKLSIKEWNLIESSDMFQTANYAGGFDGTEMEFTFSYYYKERYEFWFQIALVDINKIVNGSIAELDLRPVG